MNMRLLSSSCFSSSMKAIASDYQDAKLYLVDNKKVDEDVLWALWDHAKSNKRELIQYFFPDGLAPLKDNLQILLDELLEKVRFETNIRGEYHGDRFRAKNFLVSQVFCTDENNNENMYLKYYSTDYDEIEISIHSSKSACTRNNDSNDIFDECIKLANTTGELILYEGSLIDGARCMMENGIPAWIYSQTDDLLNIDIPSLYKLIVYTQDDSRSIVDNIASTFQDRCECLEIARWNDELNDYEWLLVHDPDCEFFGAGDEDEEISFEEDSEQEEFQLPSPASPKSFDDYLEEVEISDKYLVKNNGMWIFQKDDSGKTKKVRFAYSGVLVAGLARTENQSDWMKLLVWTDADGAVHEQLFPSEFVLSFKGVKELLGSQGCDLKANADKHLKDYLNDCRPTTRYRLVRKTGWYTDANGKELFALPNQIIGNGSNEQVYFHPDSTSNCSGIAQKGSFAQWQENVAALTRGNPLLIFALSTAFASSLLRIVGGETGGFHLYGQTSRGKTTAMVVAASVWGNASPPSNNLGHSFINTWKATANALEGVAAARNDILLILDELGQTEIDNMAKTVYDLCSGVGKERMGRNSNLVDKLQWREIFLSTGEISAKEVMERFNTPVKGGQLIRLIDIDIEDGIVQDTHGRSSAEFVDALREDCANNYGWAGPLFVKKMLEIIGDSQSEKELGETHAKCFDYVTWGGTYMEVEQHRVAKRFALVLLAGIYAVRFGILPLKEKEVAQAMRTIYFKWIQTSEPLSDTVRAIESIRDFIASNSTRFYDSDTTQRMIPSNTLGFQKTINDELFYLFPTATFNKAINSSHSRSVLRKLDELGLIHRNNGTRFQARFNDPSCSHEINAPKLSFYTINAKILNYGQPVESLREKRRIVVVNNKKKSDNNQLDIW